MAKGECEKKIPRSKSHAVFQVQRDLERATAEARVYHRHSRLLNADERREARGQAALCLPLLPMSAARPAIFGHTVFQVQHIQCDSFTRGNW